MDNTPDRAALAERLREMLAEVRRTQHAVSKMMFSPESLRDEAITRSEEQAEALTAAIAALAAPAPVIVTLDGQEVCRPVGGDRVDFVTTPPDDDSVPGPLDLAYQRGVATERAHWRKATGRTHWNEPLPANVIEARSTLIEATYGEFARPCPEREACADALIAAVRSATFAEVVSWLRSDSAAEHLAHRVDDVSPQPTHAEDIAHARIYCRTLADEALRALTHQP